MKINDLVRYANPMDDEIDMTYKVTEISESENWCLISAQIPGIQPTETANITDLEIITG